MDLHSLVLCLSFLTVFLRVVGSFAYISGSGTPWILARFQVSLSSRSMMRPDDCVPGEEPRRRALIDGGLNVRGFAGGDAPPWSRLGAKRRSNSMAGLFAGASLSWVGWLPSFVGPWSMAIPSGLQPLPRRRFPQQVCPVWVGWGVLPVGRIWVGASGWAGSGRWAAGEAGGVRCSDSDRFSAVARRMIGWLLPSYIVTLYPRHRFMAALSPVKSCYRIESYRRPKRALLVHLSTSNTPTAVKAVEEKVKTITTEIRNHTVNPSGPLQGRPP